MKVNHLSNLIEDEYACASACVGMVLNTLTDNNFSVKEVDKLLGRKKGKWVFPFSVIKLINDYGLKCSIIWSFPYENFIRDNKKVLLDEEWVERQEKYGIDLKKEAGILREMYDEKNFISRRGTYIDIEKSLCEGGLVIAWVNQVELNNVLSKEVMGHFVVVKELFKNDVVFSDPGFPYALPDRKFTKDKFEASKGLVQLIIVKKREK